MGDQLTMLVKETLAKNSGTLSGAMVSLHRSRLSHIYLTTWLDSILINKCKTSTICPVCCCTLSI